MANVYDSVSPGGARPSDPTSAKSGETTAPIKTVVPLAAASTESPCSTSCPASVNVLASSSTPYLAGLPNPGSETTTIFMTGLHTFRFDTFSSWRVLALGRSQTMVSRNEWNCQISGRRHHARLLRAAPGVESGDRFGSEAVRGVSDTGQWPSRRRPTLAVSQGAHWMRAGCVSLASCFGPGASGGPRSGLRRSGTRARPGSTAR